MHREGAFVIHEQALDLGWSSGVWRTGVEVFCLCLSRSTMGPASPIRPITPPRRVLVTRSFRTRGEIEGFVSDWRLGMHFVPRSFFLSSFLPSFYKFFLSRFNFSIGRRIEDIWLREFFKLVGEQLCDENDINLITSLSDCAQ